MKSFKNLFAASDDASDSSEEAYLLSDILELKGGYLDESEIKTVLDYAKELQAIEKKSDNQILWLDDFINNIGMVLAAEKELSTAVIARASKDQSQKGQAKDPPVVQGGEPGPSTSKSNPEPIYDRPTGSRNLRHQQALNRPLPKAPIPAIKLNELAIKPEKFDGKNEDARQWLEDFEAASEANGWTERVKVKYLSTFLVKSARNWFIAIAQPSLKDDDSWQSLRSRFLRYYVGPEEDEAIRQEIRKARQKYDESATEFIARLVRLMRILDESQPEREMVREVKFKLRDIYQDRLIGQKLETIDDLNDLCLEIERRAEVSKVRKEFRNKLDPRKKDQNQAKSKEEDSKKTTTSSFRQKFRSATDKPLPPMRCSHCNKDGHTVQRCWAKHGMPERSTAKKVATSQSKQTSSNLPNVVTIKNISSGVVASSDNEGIFVPIKLNGANYNAFVDSGSKRSLIDSRVAHVLKLKPDGTPLNLMGVDCKNLQCFGNATIEFSMTIGDTTKIVTTKFGVVKNLCVPVIVGLELLGWLNAAANFQSKSIHFENEKPDEKPQNNKPKSGLRVKNDTRIPARTQSVVCTVLPTEVNDLQGQSLMAIPLQTSSSLLVANTISKVQKDGSVECLVANLESDDLMLKQGMQIACFETTEDSVNIRFTPEADLVSASLVIATTGETIQVGEHLSGTQVEDLRALIETNIAAFSLNNEIGRTSLIKHDIELVPNSKPYVEPLRRRPLIHTQEAEKQIAQMLKSGIVEHSSSPWASAYVIVKKKTGDLRLCIDFRRLNDMTKKNVYPLPNIEDCLEPLSGNKYFSQLDLASGYWQIEMSDRAKEYTAFRTESGHYQFNRMPFGLCNAPASFQRLVNALFSGLKGVHLQVFVDDICVATKTWEEHLSLLDKVFKLLIKANLRLKSSKCMLGSSKVIFLGHELSASGIRQDPNKMVAIQNLPTPKDPGEVRRVLGLLGYYRRFVPRYSEISEPLTRLTRKDVIFKWEEEQEKAFRELKSSLARNPVLGHFNHQDPIVLKTDASRQGIAGVLLQGKDDDYHIITCCSRRLSQSEENYGISDLEGLAIIYSVTKLRNYLLGKPFTILTDHCALCALKLKMPNSPRLRRWAIILSEYDFVIKYVRGGMHRDVDCLSRAPVADEDDKYLDDKIVAAMNRAYPCSQETCAIVIPLDVQSWKQMSESDPEGMHHFERARKREKGYKILRGLLYLENRLFVPLTKRTDILNEGHADTPSCHGGVRATAERLADYWWPSMAKDIQQFVESCAVCQARKAERALPTGSMQSFTTLEPFELVSIDMLGPFKPSINGSKHVFVAIDTFTRFVDAVATPNEQGETCARLITSYVGRFGAPRAIVTDNAPTFCNASVALLMGQFKIEHRKSTPGHHQGNAPAERAIQSLQEKMSLIIHDPIASVDWESALASAVLSMNTTCHATLGYTPYELLFGKRHRVVSELTHDAPDPVAIHAELHELRRMRSHADVIALQANARESYKKRYDAKHRQREFQVGSLVLARVIGRRAKLQNRYVGPYIVVARKNDIYDIQSQTGRKECLQRHVNDLKPFIVRNDDQTDHSDSDSDSDGFNSNQNPSNHSNQSSPTLPTSSASNKDNNSPSVSSTVLDNYFMKFKQLVVLLLVINPALTFKFDEAPVLSWQPTQTYVSPHLTVFRMLAGWQDSCQVLRQYRITHSDETEHAVQACLNVFSEQISTKLELWSTQTGRTPKVVIPTNKGVLVNKQIVENNIQAPIFAIRPVMQPGGHEDVTFKNSHLGYPNGRDERRTSQLRIPEHKPEGLHRDKRGLTDFITGAIVSNVLETVVDRVWPNPAVTELQDHGHIMDHRLNELNAKSNFTQLQVMALSENVELNTQLVEHNVERIDTITTTYPVLSVVTSNIIAKTHIIGSLMDKVRTSFRMRRPDMVSLHLLLNFDPLLDVEPGSIVPESVSFVVVGRNRIQIEFAARCKASDTMVYKVNSFKFWANLLEQKATLMRYSGPEYVLFNESSNCAKAIHLSQASFVTAQCGEQDFKDQRLSNWAIETEQEEPNKYLLETAVFEAWPNVLVYCYPSKIEINKEKVDCPPFPFKLDATLRWSTPTYNHSPSVIEFNTNIRFDTLVTDIAEYHLHDTNSTLLAHRSDAVKRVRELNRKIVALEQEDLLM